MVPRQTLETHGANKQQMLQLELLDSLLLLLLLMLIMMIPHTDEFVSFPFNWHMKNVHKWLADLLTREVFLSINVTNLACWRPDICNIGAAVLPHGCASSSLLVMKSETSAIVEILSKWWFTFYAEKYRHSDIFTDLISVCLVLLTDGLCCLLTISHDNRLNL
jgi:hypothetical protein